MKKIFLEKYKMELNIQCQLPNIDKEKIWSSTLIMIWRAFATRWILNAVASCIDALTAMDLTKVEVTLLRNRMDLSKRRSHHGAPKWAALCHAKHDGNYFQKKRDGKGS